MTVITRTRSQDLRFKYYHQLEQIYHQLLDDLAEAGFPENTTGRIAQAVMLSRQEGLKHIVSPEEIEALKADGLIKLFADGIEVTPTGRLLIRNIASVFDTYLTSLNHLYNRAIALSLNHLSHRAIAITLN